MADLRISEATTATWGAAIRLRTSAYSGQPDAAADAAKLDPDDQAGLILVAELNGSVIATMRLNWVDQGVTRDVFDGLQLGRFLVHVPAHHVVVVSGFAIAVEHRGGSLAVSMMRAGADRIAASGAEVVVCDCQPHLLDLYRRVGFRIYASPFDHPQGGVVIPLALLAGDIDYLRDIRSPLADVFAGSAQNRPSLVGLRATLGRGSEASVRFDSDAESLADLPLDGARLFQGLDDAERARLLKRGLVLELADAQRLIVDTQPTRTLYVVLDGVLDIIRDGRHVGVSGAGDLVGEIAALLDIPRTATVVARGGARVLALSDGVLRQTLEAEPSVGSTLLLNLARELARKLLASPISQTSGLA
jgi:predicted N-acetyltransferase YhbS